MTKNNYGADCKVADPCIWCSSGLGHPPALYVYDPGSGEYVPPEGSRCTAIWASTGPGGHVAGEICGREATRELGDAHVCEHHYKRARAWVSDEIARLTPRARKRDRELHDKRMAMDRERAEQQIELDKERIRAEEAARSEYSLVYYVQRESDGLIKIGTSRTIHGRMAALKTAYGPLRLLATHGGTHIEEHAIHDRFSALLAEGREWFRPGLPLLEHIDEKRRWHSKMPERLAALPPFVSYGELTAMVAKAGGITDGRRRRRKTGTGTAALRARKSEARPCCLMASTDGPERASLRYGIRLAQNQQRQRAHVVYSCSQPGGRPPQVAAGENPLSGATDISQGREYAGAGA